MIIKLNRTIRDHPQKVFLLLSFGFSIVFTIAAVVMFTSVFSYMGNFIIPYYVAFFVVGWMSASLSKRTKFNRGLLLFVFSALLLCLTLLPSLYEIEMLRAERKFEVIFLLLLCGGFGLIVRFVGRLIDRHKLPVTPNITLASMAVILLITFLGLFGYFEAWENIIYDKTGILLDKSADSYFNIGNKKYRRKEYKTSIQDFNKVIELDPNKAWYYKYRGYSKSELQDYEGAIKDYDKAIELNPNVARVYIERASAKKELQDYEEALQDYNKGIDLHNKEVELNPDYYSRDNASIKFWLKDRELIRNKVKGYEPNDAYAYRYRANLKTLKNDYQGAIEDYTKAIEIKSKDTEAYKGRAWAKSYLQDYNGAIEDFNKAIEINPNDGWVVIDRDFQTTLLSANQKVKLQDYIGAIQDYNKIKWQRTATVIMLNHPWAHFNKGMAKIYLGRKDSGCRDLSFLIKKGLLVKDQTSTLYGIKVGDAILQHCN
jgi:tetratricopeptide (TPR) repeat protein